MTKPHFRPLPLLALAALALGMVLSWAAQGLENLEQFPRSTLSVDARSGAEWFSIWIADTPARSEQGLMYLKWLPEDQGMLFPQAVPRVMSMWMKNTLIPLDMLFIDEHGRVVYIRERATPQSEDIISTPLPVKAVLELAGGLCAKLGIKVGDKVHHGTFGSEPAGPARKN
jgi:uncharacterized protein